MGTERGIYVIRDVEYTLILRPKLRSSVIRINVDSTMKIPHQFKVESTLIQRWINTQKK